MAAHAEPTAALSNELNKRVSRFTPRVSLSSLARVNLQEEKELLSGLNSRLAAYIDEVHRLQAENLQLSHRVLSFEETAEKEVGSVRRLFESELSEARKLLDTLAREKAQLQIDVGKYRSEAEDWMLKHNRKDVDIAVLQQKFLESESHAAHLEAKVLEGKRLLSHWQSECARLRGDLEDVSAQLVTARRQLEGETVLRVDLENKAKSLEEELSFASQLHETELSSCHERLEVSIQECTADPVSDYNATIRQALDDVRKECDAQVKLRHTELQTYYYQKIESLKSQLVEAAEAKKEALVETNVHRAHVTELQGSLKEVTGMKEALQKRVELLEAELAVRQESAGQCEAERHAQLAALLSEAERQTTRYRDLLDVKLDLDLELATYRHLLDDEERRLGVLANSSRDDAGQPSRKRARQSTVIGTSAELTVPLESSRNSLSVKIAEVDIRKKFVRLRNETEKDISLGDWLLTIEDDTGRTLTFKFNRPAKIGAEKEIRVWAADTGKKTNARASTYVMKEGEWTFVGGTLKVALFDKEAKRVAAAEFVMCDPKPEQLVDTEVRSSHMHDPESCKLPAAPQPSTIRIAADSSSTILASKERCSLM